MQRLYQGVRQLLPSFWVGLGFGVIEGAVVAATRAQLFLSIREFSRFVLIAAFLAASLQLMIGCAVAAIGQLLSRRARETAELRGALLTGLFAAPLCVWLFWSLSQGRRLRDWNLRPLVVCLVALVCAAVLMWLGLTIMRLTQRALRARRIGFWLLALVSFGCVLADAMLLRRLYPAFHNAATVFALLCAAGAAAVWPFALPYDRRIFGVSCALALTAGLAGPFLLRATERAPNLRYAIEQSAPVTGKLLRLLRVRQRANGLRATTPAAAMPARNPNILPSDQGVSLRGDDVLLITIDALRADRLRSYGSRRGLTPQLDRLAEQSAVFAHAYTQTPHTSYALGSLFTGKYLRPVLSLTAAPQEHATLAQLLRRYGYRTAAFYPPAVFFVDEDRFKGLAREHFGFEYVKEMFAPADQRVTQLADYLKTAAPGHPLFVWVHLFEPHEPYEPIPAFARGDELEQRYDGEVAAADAAVGRLIEVFRARKPDATVIVSADHGEEFGDHGGHHHGTTLFDEQVRVPLLWSSPGRVPPKTIQAAAQLIDIAPTLLSALGVPRDARMRGNDLSPELAGAPERVDLRAFASIDELRMWTDGRHKLVCEASEGGCRLYDLVRDPGESRDVSQSEPKVASQFAAELSTLVASIPDVEAMAMQSGDAWPKALARARLGDVSAGPELMPLLSDARPAVRAETLRAIAALRLTAAASNVATLASRDASAEVREEASLTSLILGNPDALPPVRTLLQLTASAGGSRLDLARRAAFAVTAVASDRLATAVLLDLAADSGAGHLERARAVSVLGSAHAVGSVERLLPLLEDLRLRPAVARALGQLGGRVAQHALTQALSRERYPEARTAEAEALLALQDPQAKKLILRFLGTETGLPGGLALWASVIPAPPKAVRTGVVFDLRKEPRHSGFPGKWACKAQSEATALPGCTPGHGAELNLAHIQSPAGDVRALLTVWAGTNQEWLRVGEREFQLRRGSNELAFPTREHSARVRWPISSSPNVRIQLLGIVPRAKDIPPPPPEPFIAAEASEAVGQ